MSLLNGATNLNCAVRIADPRVKAVLPLDGSAQVLVSPQVDSFRFDDLWNLDLRLAKNLNAGRVNMLLTADLFNATNSNAVLKRQRNVASPVFNTITQNLSPRILRLGLRLSF